MADEPFKYKDIFKYTKNWALRAVPPVGFRFGVLFLFGGIIPNPIDCRFRKVSGICSSISTRTLNEGGQNLYSHKLPERVQYDNLVLERGLVVGSPLVCEINDTMSSFQFKPANVLVTLLDEKAIPISAWLFRNAYPVKWKVSDLDADSNTVVIETMELAYQRMQAIRI
ncbi:MAG: phage tail protein [Candidatus Methylumidiphilus alinenensis]|uniref:Phage tail protein n=1 Tax=Candidatus Methylumidiphilus alinenensis TaxID=2202197 RepID=A0A2W4RYM4_9GAMM|nr:MAG: phage tail protein [Candidatus Methylumidiphilus alinenensis]